MSPCILVNLLNIPQEANIKIESSFDDKRMRIRGRPRKMVKMSHTFELSQRLKEKMVS